MGKIIGQIGLSSWGRVTSLKEGKNSELKVLFGESVVYTSIIIVLSVHPNMWLTLHKMSAL